MISCPQKYYKQIKNGIWLLKSMIPMQISEKYFSGRIKLQRFTTNNQEFQQPQSTFKVPTKIGDGGVP